MRLPIREKHFEHEPAYDLFRRLGMRFGHASPQAFAADLGLDWRLVRSGQAIKEIAELGDVDPRRLAAATPLARDDIVVFGSTPIPRKFWQPGERCCPSCLMSDRSGHERFTGAYRRNWWDLTVVGRCPDHGNLLIDKCPRCGTRLSVHGRPICICGEDLAETTSRRSPEDGGWEQYLVNALHRVPNLQIEVLDKLRPSSLIQGVLALGQFCRPATHSVSESAAHGFRCASLGDRAVEVAMEGRRPFQVGKDSIRQYLHPMSRWLSDTDDPGKEAIAGLLRKYARQHIPITSSTVLIGEKFQSPTFVEVRNIANLLHISRQEVQEVYRFVVGRPERRPPTLIPVDVAAKMQREVSSSWKIMEASRRISVTPAMLKSIISSGNGAIMRSAWSTGFSVFVPKRDIAEIEAKANECSIFVDEEAPDVIGYHELFHRSRVIAPGSARGFLLAEVLVAFKTGKLKAAYRLRRDHLIPSPLFLRDEIGKLADVKFGKIGSLYKNKRSFRPA